MPSLSTHILDAAGGGPQPLVWVEVRDHTGAAVASGQSDARGRIEDLAPALPPGRYQITWELGGDFLAAVSATVDLGDERGYHVPILASAASAVVYLGA